MVDHFIHVDVGWDGLGLDILQIKDQKTQMTIPSVGLLKHVLFKQEGVS